MIHKKDNFYIDKTSIYSREYNVKTDIILPNGEGFKRTNIGKQFFKLLDIEYILFYTKPGHYLKRVESISKRYKTSINNRKYLKKVKNRLKLQLLEMKRGKRR